jgi:hypothetical protein
MAASHSSVANSPSSAVLSSSSGEGAPPHHENGKDRPLQFNVQTQAFAPLPCDNEAHGVARISSSALEETDHPIELVAALHVDTTLAAATSKKKTKTKRLRWGSNPESLVP